MTNRIHVSLRDCKSLERIASTSFATARERDEARWPWIVGVVANDFDCPEDAVDLIEDKHGRDVITVKGEPVAYLNLPDWFVEQSEQLEQAAE